MVIKSFYYIAGSVEQKKMIILFAAIVGIMSNKQAVANKKNSIRTLFMRVYRKLDRAAKSAIP